MPALADLILIKNISLVVYSTNCLRMWNILAMPKTAHLRQNNGLSD